MTTTKKLIGRLPILLGEYDSTKTYNKRQRVTLYGSEFESKVDNNTTAPATLNNGTFTINDNNWRVVSNGTEAFLAGEKLKHFNEEDNPEFVSANTDNDGRILESTDVNGKKTFYDDVIIKGNVTSKAIDTKINDAIENKIDKVEGKSLIDENVANSLSEEDNPEYIKALTDSVGKLIEAIGIDGIRKFFAGINIQGTLQCVTDNPDYLVAWIDNTNKVIFAIQHDGNPYFGYGVPKQIKTVIDKINTDLVDKYKKSNPNDEEGNVIDTNSIKSVVNNPEYFKAFVDNTNKLIEAIGLDGVRKFFAGIDIQGVSQCVIDNPEYIIAWVDKDDKILIGIRRDGEIIGEIHAVNALKQVIFHLQSDLASLQEKVAEFSHIEDPEGRTEITTDAEGKVLGYREEDGTRFENRFKTNKLSMPSDGLSDFAKQLSKSGLTSSGACDWSNYNSNNGEKPLQLPIPNCAIINISNADKSASWAEGKNSNFVYTLEYSDMQGNYFKKNIIMNAQGNSSLLMIKKNASIDLFDESVYDSEGNKGKGAAFSIKFGDWVAQDSFHLKAFYNDFFKGCSFIVYQIANEVMKSYGLTKDRPWKRALIGDYTGTGQDGKQIDDISLQIDNGARCMPDGFPCIAYLNGKFYGIFTFALKKHRDNYHMSKKKAEHIHLDGTNQTFFDGTIKWSDFEVRNPKSSLMCCTTLKEGTTEYESYSEGKELLGDDAEYFDSENKAHVLSNKVKRSIESLSKRLTEAKAQNSPMEQKAYIEKYFDVDSILDYILVATATHEVDGSFANWQWITYDGIKWYICNYDKDRSFGNSDEYLRPAITEGSWMYNSVPIFKFFEDLYSKELKDKWNEYVQKGIFTYENFIGKINSWVQRIGQANYEKEYDKWKEAPCNRDNLSDTEHWMLVDRAFPWTWYNTYKEGNYCCDINTTKVYKAIKQSNNIKVTNTEYWQDITYEASKQYNINDICGYGFSFGNIDNGFYVFKAIVDTIGNVPIKGTYGNYPRVMGYRDNIWRISNYVKQTLETIQRFVDNL